MSKEKVITVSGKRKTSVARATIKKGRGTVKVNSVPIDLIKPVMYKNKIQQALGIAAEHVPLNQLDIKVNVKGGGIMGQADAAASSIARGLVGWDGGDELLSVYHSYDRTLIAGDHRQTEPHKPGQSSQGPRHKRQKSYR